MKPGLFFLFLITSFFCGSAQNSANDTLAELQFSPVQKAAWDSLESAWIQKHFNPFLKKNKLKISCAGCDRITFDVYFPVGNNGTAEPVLVNTKKCGSDFTKKQKDELKRILALLQFPECFYNSKIRVFMGRALKC